ncbi:MULTISPECIES: type II toxin-antitoxin system PemK/MazF family toxin [Nostoc]|uniref:Type II toxin-antitoxin system PemK/MazF family toxin n=1 Tax=Nostoc paludosum FACHB-159 TaxID=2692908 RepID=A0ABR8KBE5_9NOSO|nr:MULTISPECIES: type II toxin-antitoxin system PemK/MazF family toxin [Nostoc]MBD2679912.1 type II toxin-antitoxin system PemK/MazF family toxin [Nostoc sp. FACHB-857]MBD2736166.1 type II toxin-antitoxin system PemK/MazF family toxin [Nostoc paludosum FACHB-159]
MNLQRGDVVLCRVPMPSTRFTQFKVRPAVVISANQLNQILDDLMVVPCTSNTNRPLTVTQYLYQFSMKMRLIILGHSELSLENLCVPSR